MNYVESVTIEISRPELEALIEERLRTGAFQNVEEVLLDALKSAPDTKPVKRERPAGRKSLVQLFAESPFKGLDLEFKRDSDLLRPTDL